MSNGTTAAPSAAGGGGGGVTEEGALDPALTNMPPSDEAVHDCPVDADGDLEVEFVMNEQF